MAKETEKFIQRNYEDYPVHKGDVVSKVYSDDIAEVFLCVCADEEVFVLGKAKFKAVPSVEGGEIDMKDHSTFDYELCGCSWENLKAYKNDEETLNKNKFDVL